MKFSVIITSANESKTIGKAIRQVIKPNKNLWDDMEIIVIAPDTATLDAARNEFKKHKFTNSKVLKDKRPGKPAALNDAVAAASGKILILTDGDMYIDDKAIKLLLPFFDNQMVGGVSGHPLSLDSDKTQFGFYSHVFAYAAHLKRLSGHYTHMSGYLYAIRNMPNLFPIAEELRAEDAYISRKIIQKGYKIDYEPNALCYVSFPKNMKDWVNQKLRSLGGNIQLENYFRESKMPFGSEDLTQTTHQRSIFEDLTYFLVPLTMVKTSRQFVWTLKLYPLRLYLWVRIYIQHKFGTYSEGKWKCIESTK